MKHEGTKTRSGRRGYSARFVPSCLRGESCFRFCLLCALCVSVAHSVFGATNAPAFHVYVSNERSNDVSVIDPATNQLVATISVGKRPRGIRVSHDGRFVYVALSGTPITPPGQKEDDDAPKGDRAADGIGVIDVAARKLV